MADLFDCTPRMAAKLARCAHIARKQRRHTGDPMAPFNPYYSVAMTDNDFRIIVRQLPRFRLYDANT